MADLEDQQNANSNTEQDLVSMFSAQSQAHAVSDSPALDLLEAKLLNRHKREAPHTYRRPDYLQYIEYA